MIFSETKNSKLYYMHSIICLAIMAGFGSLPLIEPLTPLGMKIIGIFLGMVYGWLTVGLHWPSIAGLIMLGMTDYSNMNGVFKEAFGNNTILLLMFVYILAGVLDKAGLTRYICLRIVSIKWAKGKPWVLTFLVLMMNYVCSALLPPSASLLICWYILYGICEVCGYKPGEKWPMLMVVGVMFSGNIAGQMFPYKALAITVCGQYEAVMNSSINYFGYTMWMLVTSFVSVVIYYLVCRYVFRPDVSKLVHADVKLDETLSSYQKFVFIVFIGYVLCMLLPGIMPAEWAITVFFNKLGNTAIAAIVVCILLFMNFKQGRSLNEMMFDGVRWEVLFLIASALTIAGAFRNPDTGIENFFVQYAQPLMEGKTGIAFIIVAVLVVSMITQFCNNAATGTIFTPIILMIMMSIGDVGVDTRVIMLMLVQACAVATLFPSGGATAALLHGNQQWIPKTTDLYICAVLMLLINFFSLFVIGIPLSKVLPL